MQLAISIPLVSFFVALLAVGWLARSRLSWVALDEPNARSLHTTPVPRTGGIGLLLGIATGWAIIGPDLPWSFWTALVLLIAVSILDDLHGLSAAARLGVHLLAAALAALAFMGTHESLLLLAIVILTIGWFCNLYNFMDGSDGLAGGMALFGFTTYATAAWLSGSPQFALLNISVASAAAGFLLHNFHPARIFLGDAGAVPLGFLAAAFGVVGWLQHEWPWWFPLLVFSPFIVDASVTLVRRLLAGTRVWEAHRDHYYQRLVRMGWGHRRTALAEYSLMALCGVTALAGLHWSPSEQGALLLAAVIIYGAAIGIVENAWRGYCAANSNET